MIEIKNVIFTKHSLNCFKAFFCLINHILPLRLKFESESFAAVSDKERLGLITLDKDSKSFTRFKITKLFLEENSYTIARQLVNYVISRYRAMGATSFYVVADEKQAELINIFKNELNFRACGFEYLYKVNEQNHDYIVPLKPFKKEYLNEVTKFYNENINSFNRFLFCRFNYQFLNNCSKYVFYNEDEMFGYFEVATSNNTDYYINFSIDFAYNIYLTDAVKYIYSKIKQKNRKFNLYIKVKDYFMNSKELLSILKENNFEFVSKSQILAKDYYREIKDNSILKNAKIIFNDPTMA